jgi:predicted amidohydrolase YtcJ
LPTLAAQPGLSIRLSNFIFARKPGIEVDAWKTWTAEEKPDLNRAVARLNRYVLEGAGEILVCAASDFENFMAPRPVLNEQALQELTEVTRVIASHRWPIRIHATYDEPITRILDVFEQVFKETDYRSRWAIDHAETIPTHDIARVKALGGGIAIQNRLAFTGEFFLERYGEQASASTAPIQEIVHAGIPVGAGTDATRVNSYNPWLSLAWIVTGQTAGGTQIASPSNRPSREEALWLYTLGSVWFSGEEDVKGRIAPDQYADFAILSADYLSVPEEQIGTIESVLTVTGGDVVYSAPPFTTFAPEQLSSVHPEWSPVAVFGGFQRADEA